MENIVTILGNLELQLQRIRLLYLEWALEHFRPPTQDFAGLGTGGSFRLIGSPNGGAFQVSPCGQGSLYVGDSRGKLRPPDPMWQEDNDLARDLAARMRATKKRLSEMTGELRCALRKLLYVQNYGEVWGTLQDYWWVKLGMHELACDGELGKEPGDKEKNPVRWQLIKSSHLGENLRTRPPDFSASDIDHFIGRGHGLTWGSYAPCSFECGPIAVSKGGFVRFSDIAQGIAQLCARHSSESEGIALVKSMLKEHYDLLLCYDEGIPAQTHREFQDNKDRIRQVIKRMKECIGGREAQLKPAQTK